MSNRLVVFVCFFLAFAVNAFANVSVISPGFGATIQSPVHYVATATTGCSAGVASMGIYTAPYVLSYVANGSNLDANLTLSPGTYNTVVEAWDYCGGATTAPVTITVVSATQAGVYVTSPANQSTVNSPVPFIATATTNTTTCPAGVAAMGIYTAPYVLAYTVGGASLNTNLPLSPGTYNAVVEEWDRCGGAATKPITITVASGGGNTFSNLQASAGWTGYGELPPTYAICDWCSPYGPQITWSLAQGVGSPSLSGNSSQFDIGGSTVYSDVLWNNHLIGDLSSQGLPDPNHTLVPSLHNFTYDVYFYGNDLEVAQSLEFDVNQFFGGLGFIFGHECRIAGGHAWAVWNNVNAQWVLTGIPCNPVSNSWNHVTLQVQRTSDNHLLYQSITLNGVTSTLNWYFAAGSSPGWNGITVNYQMDGNYAQQPYTVWLDRLNFSYW